MKQYVSVETLEKFCGRDYKKAEKVISEMIDNADFLLLPWGCVAETIAEQFNVGNMIEFFHNKDIKITLDNCIPASVQVWEKGKAIREYCEMELCDALLKAIEKTF